MSVHLEYTAGALADLDAVWAYTVETWGVDQAERYIEALENACHGLAAGSINARPFPAHDQVSGYYHCEHHYIFFRQTGDKTIILAVLHERMDLIARVQNRF